MHQQDSAPPSQQGPVSEPHPPEREPQRPITGPLRPDIHEQSTVLLPAVIEGDTRPQLHAPPFLHPRPVLHRRYRRPPSVLLAGREHSRAWPWVLAAALLIVVLVGIVALVSTVLYRTVSESKLFSVGSAPLLMMNIASGSVHIESGLPGQVSVITNKYVFLGDGSLLPITYTQRGSTLFITADAPNTSAFFSNTTLEFDIFVPSQSNLGITVNSGAIQTNGITGTIQLHTSNGSIQADNLAGALTLKAANGTIMGSNLKGQMTLSTTNGALTVRDVNATDNSSFQTDSGFIDFQGTLAPSGTFLYRTSSGSIELRLSKDASFHVDASTASGSIGSEFHDLKVQPDTPGAEAHGDVGAPPLSTIILQTESGSIMLRQE